MFFNYGALFNIFKLIMDQNVKENVLILLTKALNFSLMNTLFTFVFCREYSEVLNFSVSLLCDKYVGKLFLYSVIDIN